MTVASVRAETAKLMAAPSLQCSFCFAPTPYETLSRLGSRCHACFDRFCREHQPSIDVGDRRVMGSRAWAHALQRRDAAGEKLTPYQRWAWRRVLDAHRTLDAARDGAEISEYAISKALESTGDIKLPPMKPILADVPWCDRDEIPAFDQDER